MDISTIIRGGRLLGRLTIINRLSRLSLILLRENLVNLFLLNEWGHDGALVFFEFRRCLIIINMLNFITKFITN